MRIPISIIVLVVFIFLAGCGGKKSGKPQHSGVEYYRHLLWSETPYDTEKGIFRLDSDEAETVNNYKFTYDDDGRLQSVEFVRNNVLLGYSSMHNIAKIVYNYEGHMQTMFFYNEDNEPVEHEGIFAVQYALDARGNRVQLMYLAKDGSMINNHKGIHYYNWSVLPDGNVSEKRFSLDGTEIPIDKYCSFYELRFTYNKKGYLTRLAHYRNDTLINCHVDNAAGSKPAYLMYNPDENGSVEKVEVFDETGQPVEIDQGWSKCINKYDENGYLIETVCYNKSNEYTEKIPVKRYSYDDHGALTEIKFYNKDNQQVKDPLSGAAVIKYTYDDAGQRTDTVYLDLNNAEIEIHPPKMISE